MAKAERQKQKILYIMKYMLNNTDEDHAVSVNELIDYLQALDIPAERKSIYKDIGTLTDFGFDIEKCGAGTKTAYYIASRDFELPELKLLVDSIQSSKFITHKKTTELIKKLETLASAHQAQLLQRQVYVTNRIKQMNESIYYNVDEIHNGITYNRRIKFQYFKYNISKEKVFRHDGAFYEVSPFALTWDDENYYLVAFDSDAKMIKHFRVDRMANISISDQVRDGRDVYEALDMAVYSRKIFGMFRGDERKVRMRFDNQLVDVVLDRLGRDAMLIPDGDAHFTVTSDIVVSPQFFGWICGFSDLAQILGPEDVVKQMKEHVRNIAAQYTA